MKKLLLLFAVALLPLCANAQALIDGIFYDLNSTDKTARVTSNPERYYGNSYSGDVEIPQSVTYNDVTYNVNGIGYRAFYNCNELSKISIPNSITSVGSEAFLECVNLTSVNISDIESWCKVSFNEVTSNPLTYAHHLYVDGKEVTDLTIPDGVESILPYAFYGCSGLSSVTLSNNVKTVGRSAFYLIVSKRV